MCCAIEILLIEQHFVMEHRSMARVFDNVSTAEQIALFQHDEIKWMSRSVEWEHRKWSVFDRFEVDFVE